MYCYISCFITLEFWSEWTSKSPYKMLSSANYYTFSSHVAENRHIYPFIPEQIFFISSWKSIITLSNSSIIKTFMSLCWIKPYPKAQTNFPIVPQIIWGFFCNYDTSFYLWFIGEHKQGIIYLVIYVQLLYWFVNSIKHLNVYSHKRPVWFVIIIY
jgi:hypothetical protein